MRKVTACTLALLATVVVVFGQPRSDSVKVYFHIGQWQFDSALGDNAASMNEFVERVRMASDAHNLNRIVIRACASPDGPERFNQRLSAERADAIARLIIDRTAISAERIETEPQGVSWSELRRLVAENPEVPSREKILDIIDNTPVWVFDAQGRIIDGRKKPLMDLHGGRPYNWMREHLFPELRNAVAVSLYLNESEAAEANPAAEGTNDFKDLKNSKDLETAENFDGSESSETTQASPNNPVVATIDSVAEPVPAKNSHTSRYILALKTNMLYYAALLPNLELEWLINNRWSVALEGNFASWGSYKHEKSYRLYVIDSEVRRWFKPRNPWHGMYAGLIAGGGWYDLENGNPGYYGEGLMTGLSLGYMWPIGRRLSLEAEIGAGYIYTRYKEYEALDGHHLYMRTKTLNYFGPIKAKLSIAWRLFDVNKHKRTDTAL